MDDDPLKDTLPPRYAIESDDEDEYNPLRTQQTPGSPNIDITVQGSVRPGTALVIASGQIAGVWAKGADLGEQIAAICVDKIQVGLVFTPTWTQATIVVSEAFTKLPLSFMHTYALKMYEAFRPSVMSLLDVYSSPTYSSKTPVRMDNAPLRYLSTSECKFPTSISPFQPPNLIQTTTASFLSLATIHAAQATAILVPSAQITTAPPRELQRSRIQVPMEREDNWSNLVLQEVHCVIFNAIGEDPNREWGAKDGSLGGASFSHQQTRSEVGEGGMYL